MSRAKNYGVFEVAGEWIDCPSCGGEGNHGIEPESGNPYACYACGMRGRVKATGDELVEGGFFEKDAAIECAQTWAAETGHKYSVRVQS